MGNALMDEFFHSINCCKDDVLGTLLGCQLQWIKNNNNAPFLKNIITSSNAIEDKATMALVIETCMDMILSDGE